MRPHLFIFPCLFLATACSTMNESLQLGAGLGAAAGGVATFSGYSAAGRSPSLGTVAIGATVGSAVGLLTSYLVHSKVAEDRAASQVDQTEMHFGDLPPSPFIVPRKQKGAR